MILAIAAFLWNKISSGEKPNIGMLSIFALSLTAALLLDFALIQAIFAIN
jgi:hypothetical protein